MKTLTSALFFAFSIMMLSTGNLLAQEQQDTTTVVMHVVVKHDGTEFIGKLISQDAREVLIDTKEVGQVIIPKHEIKSLTELKSNDFSTTGVYIPDEIFSTRYCITTNGLPIKKGENYIQWNLYGPDMQFGVGKNFGIGIMTSWVAAPIIGTAKYSIRLGEKTNMGLGVLLGTGSWSIPKFSLALPFAALTLGDRKANITFSGGYGAVTYAQNEYDPARQTYKDEKVAEQRTLLSIAFMFKVGRKVSFVFDSIIVPTGAEYETTQMSYNYDPNTGSYNSSPRQVTQRRPSFSLIIPGLRWQLDSKKAFQFGFARLSTDGEAVPIPIPMIQLYRKL